MKIAQLYVMAFPNGKLYFGITSGPLKGRWGSHKNSVSAGSRKRVHLAIAKYGVDNVQIRTLVIGERDYILDLEQRAIAKFNTQDRRFGYNISMGGESGALGMKHSFEAKMKISTLKMGHTVSETTRQKLRAANLGNKVSEETRRKIGIASARRKCPKSIETRAKISAALKGRSFQTAEIQKSKSEKMKLLIAARKAQGLEFWMKGTSHSLEARAKMSTAGKLREAKRRDIAYFVEHAWQMPVVELSFEMPIGCG